MIDEFHGFLHPSEDDIETIEHEGKERSDDNGECYEYDVENKCGIHKKEG